MWEQGREEEGKGKGAGQQTLAWRAGAVAAAWYGARTCAGDRVPETVVVLAIGESNPLPEEREGYSRRKSARLNTAYASQNSQERARGVGGREV